MTCRAKITASSLESWTRAAGQWPGRAAVQPAPAPPSPAWYAIRQTTNGRRFWQRTGVSTGTWTADLTLAARFGTAGAALAAIDSCRLVNAVVIRCEPVTDGVTAAEAVEAVEAAAVPAELGAVPAELGAEAIAERVDVLRYWSCDTLYALIGGWLGSTAEDCARFNAWKRDVMAEMIARHELDAGKLERGFRGQIAPPARD